MRTKSVTCQNPESRIMSLAISAGKIQNPKLWAWSSLDLGVGQGDWFDTALMIVDSWFWILDFPHARASSSRIMSSVEGSRWTRADFNIVLENSASTSDKYRQVVLNPRSTQNHDVTFHIVTPPVRIQGKLFNPPILGLWLTNGAESKATRIWELGVKNQLRTLQLEQNLQWQNYVWFWDC